jgi:hypothetical protein
MTSLRYVFDIDGTICSACPGNYTNSLPYLDRIKKVNELYDEGHHITFFTSRGMTGANGNVLLCYERYFEFTKKQLNDWGVKYHQLILGKPPAEFYIDDHASNDIDFFEENNEHHNSNYDV